MTRPVYVMACKHCKLAIRDSRTKYPCPYTAGPHVFEVVK